MILAASAAVVLLSSLVPARATTVLVSDWFGQGDAGSLGTTATGQTWRASGPCTWGIRDGMAKALSWPWDGHCEAYVNTQVSGNVSVVGDIRLSPTYRRANAGLVFLYVSAHDHMWAKIEVTPGHPKGLLTIGKEADGKIHSLLAYADAVGLANGWTYRLRVTIANGPPTRVTATVSGGNLSTPRTVSHTLTSTEMSRYSGATGYGLRLHTASDEDDGRTAWKSFTVSRL
jgi:hypothetical protein